ncbi:MAG: hypothetical protein J5518_00095 [Lachnospiraceae bacterium]|nr:hypothetical protein [Lachnospiraceae bacterium]
MNTILAKIRKITDHPLLFALLINGSALFISLFVYKPFFEESDDAYLSLLAEGAFGKRTMYLECSSTLLGRIYQCLYAVCPVVRWHTVIQYLFLFTAYTCLTYVFLRLAGRKDKKGVLAAIVLVAMTFYQSYVSLQYTKTSTIVCTVGYIALLYSMRREREDGENRDNDRNGQRGRILLRLLGWLFLIYGIMLRAYGAEMATLFMLPPGIYAFAKIVKTKDGKRIRTFILSFGIVGVLFCALVGADRMTYYSNAEWSTYFTHRMTRYRLVDRRYDLLDFTKYAQRLQEKGISENDAKMFLTWQLGDDSVFSTEKIADILQDAPQRKFNADLFKAMAEHIYEDVFVWDPLVIGAMLVLLYSLLLLWEKKDRNGICLLFTELAILICVLVYYQYSGRWSHRVVYSAMLIFPVILLYYLLTGRAHETVPCRDHYCALAILAVACAVVFLGNRFTYNDHKRDELDHAQFYEEIARHKDTLYVADSFTFMNAFRYEVFHPVEEGSMDNYVNTGSWFLNSPTTKELTRGYGYDNPIHALAGITVDGADKGSDVILVDNKFLDEKLCFLEEHYGTYEAQELPQQFGFHMYRIIKR